MHSDGNTLLIYPKLIELGLDAFNSQIFCMGLDQLEQYRGKITFWGEIDRQYLLPFGPLEEELQHYADNGLAMQVGKRWRLTPSGWLLSNQIIHNNTGQSVALLYDYNHQVFIRSLRTYRIQHLIHADKRDYIATQIDYFLSLYKLNL